MIPNNKTILSRVGDQTTLPCTFTPKTSDGLIVTWTKIPEQTVYFFAQGKEDAGKQEERYKDRTFVDESRFNEGDFTLFLEDTRVSDEGNYQCFVWFKPADFESSSLELKLHQASGFLSPVKQHQQCPGGYPEAQLVWTFSNGTRVHSAAQRSAIDSEGLVSIQSRLVIARDLSENLTCGIHNSRLSQSFFTSVTCSLPSSVFNLILRGLRFNLTMWRGVLLTCLLLHTAQAEESSNEPIYLVTIPSEIFGGTTETFCAQLLHPNESLTFTVTMETNADNLTLLEERVKENEFYRCVPFQVPVFPEETIVYLRAEVKGKTVDLEKRQKVLISSTKPLMFIQTDKPIYKPGQTAVVPLLGVSCEHVQVKEFQSMFICVSRYTYGKPVLGKVTGKFCRPKWNMYWYRRPDNVENNDICHLFNVLIKMTGPDSSPLPHEKVHLIIRWHNHTETTNFTTDSRGLVPISLDTSSWDTQSVRLQARYSLLDNVFDYQLVRPTYGIADLWLNPFYSKSKSFLKIQENEGKLQCGEEAPISIVYIIQGEELAKGAGFMDFYYLVLAKGSIARNGRVGVPMKAGQVSEGEFSFKLPVSSHLAPYAQVLVYAVFPNGEIVADSFDFQVDTCFKNKVDLKFSAPQELPGEDTTVHLRADPGSLCALRAVDQSVILMEPDKELTVDTVYNLLPTQKRDGYSYRVEDYEPYPCLPSPFHRVDKRYIMPYYHSRSHNDVYEIFKGLGLKILSNSDVKKPIECHEFYTPVLLSRSGSLGEPMLLSELEDTVFSSVVMFSQADLGMVKKEPETVRKYFPETWIWELVPVG
ncbi:UNVERIFIED_CONTAM: hypothetical protein FKN15_001442 [Acipenser sinensis]